MYLASGANLTILTHKDAPKFKIIARTFGDGKLGAAKDVIPESDGAYGIVDEPAYSPVMLAALEHGMWRAVARVRGGGVYGDAWHRAGMKATKPNTWKDFIACGEYLIDNGYSDKEKLACISGSAGGILIGRAVTELPDLFSVACPIVGALDMLRAEFTANGPPNIPEFGTVKNKAEFNALREMSTYEHISQGTAYPALLFYHGYNDPRVDVWMSAKTAARFQADTTSGKPVLLDIDYGSGHGIGNTRAQQIWRSTDVLAFMLWQFGDSEFQPSNRNRNQRTSTPAFSCATANTKKRGWIAMRSLHHLSSRTMQSHLPPIVAFLRIKLMDRHQLDDCDA
jgi:prolyl oligopeptidase